LYIVIPALIGVPAVAIVQVYGSEFTLVRMAPFVLAGWVLLLASDLVFRRRDFIFVVWGTPLGCGLLLWAIDLASGARLVRGGMCDGVVMIWVLGPATAVLVLAFLVGLVCSLASFYLWVRSRVLRSK
jgi:hypothetical protein